MREKLKLVFDKYFTQGTGAVETMMALFGAFATVREAATGSQSARTSDGVSEMLYSFSVGLPLGNGFWQRASVILFPMLAAAQIDIVIAAEYASEEKRMAPDDPRAAELRRKTAQCMGTTYTLAVMALVADKGVEYAQKNGRALRDDLAAVMEGRA